MEPSEYSRSSRRERSRAVNLNKWREELVEYTRTHLGLAEDEIRNEVGYAFSIDAPRNEPLVNLVMTGVVLGYLETIEPRLQQGDRISIKGDIIYDIYTRDGHGEHAFEPDWLMKGWEMRGKFENVSVKDYLDEDILRIETPYISDEVVAAYIRRYGPHIVLTDPIKIEPGGREHGIPDCESIFIPLTYRNMTINARPPRDER